MHLDILHLILDGRDSTYNTGRDLVEKLQAKMDEIKIGKIASISGRFYGMDRDNHWDRTAVAYRAMASGEAENTFCISGANFKASSTICSILLSTFFPSFSSIAKTW